MENIYVISDLHGHKNAFFSMLEKINWNENDRMYILGDVIDRGPDGIELLKYIKEQKNMKLFLGNHEDMMMKSLTTSADMWMGTWMFNGGDATLSAYEKLSRQEQEECLSYIKSLPLYEMIEVEGVSYLLIHAGVKMEDGSIEEIPKVVEEEDALWIREEFFNSHIIPSYYIIFGHTPTGAMLRYADSLPEEQRKRCSQFQIAFWNHRIAIDCGAAYEENLGCLRLNDLKEFYVEIKK